MEWSKKGYKKGSRKISKPKKEKEKNWQYSHKQHKNLPEDENEKLIEYWKKCLKIEKQHFIMTIRH